MARHTNELLGYAVALFTCYGVFVSNGLGRVTVSLLFLVLGIALALGVIVLDAATNADVWPSVVSVVLLSALGFAFGWGGYQVLLWTGFVGALFGVRTP